MSVWKFHRHNNKERSTFSKKVPLSADGQFLYWSLLYDILSRKISKSAGIEMKSITVCVLKMKRSGLIIKKQHK